MMTVAPEYVTMLYQYSPWLWALLFTVVCGIFSGDLEGGLRKTVAWRRQEQAKEGGAG